MPYSNSVLQDLVEAPRGCVNCNKEGRSPRSSHEVAKGDREGDVPLPRWKENGNQEMLR